MRRGSSLLWVAVGIALGLGAGLFYAWQLDPRVVTDVRPAQLSASGKRAYLVAISMAFARDRRIEIAARRLLELGSDWQDIADAACDIVQSGGVRSSADLAAVRSMVELAASQGATGCASQIILSITGTPPPVTLEPTPTPTPTLTPPPTKTPTVAPTPTATPAEAAVTPTPPGDFIVADITAFCDARLPNVIEVFVRDLGGNGIPGIKVEVSWADGREVFFTGLKPERDPGYADFQMTPGTFYQVSLPGLSERTRRLEAGSCTNRDGSRSQAGYRVTFQRARAQ